MLETRTLREQRETEDLCVPLLEQEDNPELFVFFRDKHVKFLRGMLGNLSSGFISLDASRPWMVFWAVNGLALMGVDTSELRGEIEATLLKCQHPDGGFGGGFGQPAHLACTYASIMALAHTSPAAWSKIDRKKLCEWLLTLKQPDGSFKMCLHGETDPRATYCALSVASILKIMDKKLTENVATYIKTCQTYEGGFGNQPLAEAHGGYAFCALATLHLIPDLNIAETIDLPGFISWLVARQQHVVPGFSGRINKLVDGCYGHWVGGCWALVESIDEGITELWDRDGLQSYNLMCCQADRGGLRDKPGCGPDSYHTNYVLCGLAACQYAYSNPGKWQPTAQCTPSVLPLHPVYGLPLTTANRADGWT
ncbi:Protein farnesyltransferase subunit beta [Wickerhamiella sorbophila]|uniref:Protein farnesyltransferase subunit beta n=1 Tax=Wickerhamiella sorbophila TaxID=45607 RepID=A0A2T0FD05_9ASCO|nr:Protein farnesyltransferase subunit beta [Wickerhamiella sorbophila]PRT52819.1 Protein farnesyltransferase subunit beta [Wickerhamiella sorbophila]